MNPWGTDFDFDPVNKILLMRFEGRLTEESVRDFYGAIRKNAIATNASAGIWDLSPATEFALSAEFLRSLATFEPAMPDATERPRFIVAPTMVGFGLSRMFEIMGEQKRPLLQVVRSLKTKL